MISLFLTGGGGGGGLLHSSEVIDATKNVRTSVVAPNSVRIHVMHMRIMSGLHAGHFPMITE